MDERHQKYFEFVIAHEGISDSDLSVEFPDWQELLTNPALIHAFRRHRIEKLRKKTEAARLRDERRKILEEKKTEAALKLAELIHSNDEDIVYKASVKILGGDLVYDAKRAEKEAEAEFQASLPKDQEYPDV